MCLDNEFSRLLINLGVNYLIITFKLWVHYLTIQANQSHSLTNLPVNYSSTIYSNYGGTVINLGLT